MSAAAIQALGYTVAPGGAALLLVVAFYALIGVVVPFVALWKVSEARGQSRAYVWWGLLGIPGLVVGLLVMLAMPPSGPVARRPGA